MADKNNHKKNFLNILLIGIVVICIVLLITQMTIDIAAEIATNRSNQGYSVFLSIQDGKEEVIGEPTPTPVIQLGPNATPTPTPDPNSPYYDPG